MARAIGGGNPHMAGPLDQWSSGLMRILVDRLLLAYSYKPGFSLLYKLLDHLLTRLVTLCAVGSSCWIGSSVDDVDSQAKTVVLN